MHAIFETLVRAAAQAPSGDNMQPWRFVVDGDARQIAIYLDESRDPSPMNAGQRMSRLAIGAALENLLRAAESLGRHPLLEKPGDSALALVRIDGIEATEKEVDPAIFARVTNRRMYDGRSLSAEVLEDLRRKTPHWNGIRTIWIHDRDRVESLARLIGRSQAIMLMERSMRHAFLENLRFDVAGDADVEEGLSLASLEVSAAERVALRIMPRLPQWLLKASGARRTFDVSGRKLIRSASGLCIVVGDSATAESELLAGRAAQRAWLALTESGLAAQPMMSMAILESMLQRGSPELLASLGREQTRALLHEYQAAVPEIEGADTAFLLRFGYAPPPSVITGRCAFDTNTTVLKE